MVLFHLLVDQNLHVILEQASQDLEGPQQLLYFFVFLFWRWTPSMGANKPTDTYLLQGQAPRFPYGWLKTFGAPILPPPKQQQQQQLYILFKESLWLGGP